MTPPHLTPSDRAWRLCGLCIDLTCWLRLILWVSFWSQSWQLYETPWNHIAYVSEGSSSELPHSCKEHNCTCFIHVQIWNVDWGGYLSGLLVTNLTIISNSFVNRLHMFLKVALLICYIVTKNTIVLTSFVYMDILCMFLRCLYLVGI